MSYDGDDVDVDCTATITNVGTVTADTDFIMRKNGSSWLILKWYEDGTTMFQKKK